MNASPLIKWNWPALSRPVACCALALVALSATQSAAAQSRFPERPITLIVPFAPGGVADLTARAVAQHMGHSLGQTVIVDNRPSAGSIVATQAVAKAAPDGHTLLLMSNGNALSATLFKKLPYDTQRDLAPITTLGFFDIGIFVGSSARWATLRDVLAAAKAQPGKLTVGTIAVGSTQHLAAELFKTVAGIDVLIVPYKATPAVMTALRAGEIDLAFEIVAPMLAQVNAGALRALSVSSQQRNPALPAVPTMQQAGVAGYVVASWNALAAPAGTAVDIIEKLNRAAREAVASSAVQTQLGALGVRLQAGTPEQLAQLLSSEIKRWGEVIHAAKITPE